MLQSIRYLPTKSNREMWRLEKDIRALILKAVKERKETASEHDLLHKILEAATNSKDFSQDEADRFIVDNCKSMYLAGYETTAVSATWTLMLLASNPEWQARVRAEVLQVCGGQTPDANMVRKMKVVSV